MLRKFSKFAHFTNKSKARDLLNEIGDGLLHIYAANPLSGIYTSPVLQQVQSLDMVFCGEKQPDINNLIYGITLDVKEKGFPITKALLDMNVYTNEQIQHAINATRSEINQGQLELLERKITKQARPK